MTTVLAIVSQHEDATDAGRIVDELEATGRAQGRAGLWLARVLDDKISLHLDTQDTA